MLPGLPSDFTQLYDRLWRVLAEELEDNSASLHTQCEFDLRLLILQGVLNFVQTPKRDKTVKEIEADLRQLISGMVEAARKKVSTKSGKKRTGKAGKGQKQPKDVELSLGEDTLQYATVTLCFCPCWPFC